MDKVLKQRLIGASILIALAVIFVPMLFDGPDDSPDSREMSIELPSAPGDRAPVRRLQLNPDQSRATASEDTASGPTRIDPPLRTGDETQATPSRDDLMAEIEAEAETRVPPVDAAPETAEIDREEDQALASTPAVEDVEPEPPEVTTTPSKRWQTTTNRLPSPPPLANFSPVISF